MVYRTVAPLAALVVCTLLFFSSFQTSFAQAKSRPAAEVVKEGAKNSGCDYDPYQKLYDLKVVASGANVSPNGQGKPGKGIDVSLACRLSKFLEWAKEQGCAPMIISGYRTGAEQQALVNAGKTKAGPGASCHNHGLAIDLQSRCSEKLNKAASQFQLASRVRGYPNPNHYQCLEHAGGGGRNSGCPGPCNGGIVISPDMNALANTGNYSPSSNLSNIFRQALGLNQQPQQQQPPPPIQQQPLPQAQQPSQYFPTSQTPTNTGTPTTGTQSPVNALSPESQKYLGITGPSGYTPSIADQLLELAYGTTSQTPPQNIGTTVPVYLNPNDVGTVGVQNPTLVSTSSQTTQGPPIGTLQPSQTFTSSDLNFAPPLQLTYAPPQTGVFVVLDTIKSILLRILEVLRPMGIRDALREDVHSDHIE